MTAMAELPVLKVFLSSPGDVAEERAVAEIVLRRLAGEFAHMVRLELVLWEHEPIFGHTGFQQQIERPSQCDLVINVLWSRLGTRLPSDFAPAPGQEAPTGTEFELRDALSSFATHGKPHVLIYRKVPGPQISLSSPDFAERSEQYRRLDEFCRRVFHDDEGAIVVAHRTFADSHGFERLLTAHVREWLDETTRARNPDELRPTWRGNPFRGLQSFEAEHQAIFFGRSQAISDLTRRIRETETAPDPLPKLLLVQGMSGAGKTSLIKAGLIPLLELRPIEGIARWITLQLRPSEGEHGPIGVLARRLIERIPSIEHLGIPEPKLTEMLTTHPGEAVERLEMCLAAEAQRTRLEQHRIRVLIYVDQLEEI